MSGTGLSVQAVAELVGGRLLGNGAAIVRAVAPLDRATPEAVSFIISRAYLPAFRASQAGAVLVAPALADEPAGPATRIVVADPARAMSAVARALHPPAPAAAGIDASARVGRGAQLGPGVAIGPFAVVGAGACLGARARVGAHTVIGDGVVVGDDADLGARVVLEPGTVLGGRVRVKSGSVIGGEGFGFLSGADGHERIPHVGRCLLGDDVEVGSNCTIDRGSIDDTVIGDGTKLDNLIHVGHNVRIGRRCLLMGGVMIGGSSRVGDGAILAGSVRIIDHIEIGAGARVAAGSYVFADVPAGATYGGYPAGPHRDSLRAQAAARRLPAIIADLERLVEGNGHGA